jgi:phthiocerol/phenolphthiocerol synthesis type-I polyketide synthase E
LSRGYLAPRTAVERTLCAFWQSFLGIAPIGVDDDFTELGGDSLMGVSLLAKVRAQLKVQLPANQIQKTPTIAELSQEILRRSRSEPPQDQSAPAASLIELQAPVARPATMSERLARPPLFMIHAIDGNVLIYCDLTQALGAEQPVYGLEMPPDEQSEPPQSVEALAQRYLAAIRTVQPHGPYALGGASFGGLVAWEVAHMLREQGEPVGFVALVDTPGPGQLPAPMTEEQQILDYMQRLGGSVPRSADGLQRFLRAWRQNSAALYSYVPRPAPIRVVLFRARERDAWTVSTPEQGWPSLALGGLDVYDVPGNHITMNQAPHVQAIADRLHEYLATLS